MLSQLVPEFTDLGNLGGVLIAVIIIVAGIVCLLMYFL